MNPIHAKHICLWGWGCDEKFWILPKVRVLGVWSVDLEVRTHSIHIGY